MKVFLKCDVVSLKKWGREDGVGMQLVIGGLTQEEALWFGEEIRQPVLDVLDRLHKKRGDARPYTSINFQTGETAHVTRGDKKDAN